MLSHFFPRIARRAAYATRDDGGFFDYSHYRAEIAEDCLRRCVYCGLHENDTGGPDAMELDHFRPWKKKFGEAKEEKFRHLRDVPTNLVHSCRVCNRFKWAHWPTENPDVCYDEEKGWIDPFDNDRTDFFSINIDGTLSDIRNPGRYHIAKLRLNRPFLIRAREFYLLMAAFSEKEAKWKKIIEEDPESKHATTAAEALELYSFIKKFLAI